MKGIILIVFTVIAIIKIGVYQRKIRGKKQMDYIQERQALNYILKSEQISYYDLSLQIGISETAIKNFIAGKKCYQSTVQKIKDYLKDKSIKQLSPYDNVVKQNKILQQELRGWKNKYVKLLHAMREQKIISGLWDKNDNPILDGDILKEVYYDAEGEHEDYTLCKWHQPSASFIMKHSDTDYTHFDEFDVDLNNIEVIGNEYNNPELLNKIEGYKDADI